MKIKQIIMAFVLTLLSILVCAGPLDRLEQATTTYRLIIDMGGWGTIPDGSLLRLGMVDPSITKLQKRLWLEGDLHTPPTDNGFFNDETEAAVKLFQRRHGLIADGVVGKKTRRMLNVPAGQWLSLIEQNLKKPSVLPAKMPEFYVLVNVPAFNLYVMEDGSIKATMKVITGKKTRQTPEFADTIEYVVFNPYWHVPSVITRHDLIPKQIADPTYFDRMHIRVLRTTTKEQTVVPTSEIDWSKYSSGKEPFPYTLRQDPGGTNFLGKIKFIFPNEYGVYIHDTTAKNLFQYPKRTYSSGCVRVQYPDRLAQIILSLPMKERQPVKYPWGETVPQSPTDPSQWTSERIQERIESGVRKWVSLPQKVPVYIVYYTAWSDDKGVIYFYDDVYGRNDWTPEQISCNYGSVNNTCNLSNTAEQE